MVEESTKSASRTFFWLMGSLAGSSILRHAFLADGDAVLKRVDLFDVCGVIGVDKGTHGGDHIAGANIFPGKRMGARTVINVRGCNGPR